MHNWSCYDTYWYDTCTWTQHSVVPSPYYQPFTIFAQHSDSAFQRNWHVTAVPTSCQSQHTSCLHAVSEQTVTRHQHQHSQWHVQWWQHVVNDVTLVMDALCNRADHYIFILWFILSSSSFFFSSPNLSRCRLDVYHTSTHGVALRI